MSDEDHGHIPYVFLLLHYLDRWKNDHSGAVPSTYKEKTAFRDFVRSDMRVTSTAGDEENYEEAIGAVLKTLNPSVPSSPVKDVLTAPEAKQLDAHSSGFWVIAHAVNEFYVKHGVLPLSGSLPDMKAKSHDYVTLQNAYRLKAQQDVRTVSSYVEKVEQELGRAQSIPKDEITAFCKSCGSVKVVRGKPPQLVERTTWGNEARAMAMQLPLLDSLLTLYISFLAYDTYISSHGIHSSVGLLRADTNDDLEVETDKVVGIAETYVDGLLEEAGEHLAEPEYNQVLIATANCVRELFRANGAELHNISAVMGGVVAQEAIKVITEQYVPVDNVCLFDGASSKTSVLKI